MPIDDHGAAGTGYHGFYSGKPIGKITIHPDDWKAIPPVNSPNFFGAPSHSFALSGYLSVGGSLQGDAVTTARLTRGLARLAGAGISVRFVWHGDRATFTARGRRHVHEVTADDPLAAVEHLLGVRAAGRRRRGLRA